MPSLSKAKGKWEAYGPRGRDGKRKHLGYYGSRTDAIEAEIAFRETGTILAPDRKGHLLSSFPQRGVSWHKGRKKWQAFAYARGRQVYVGQFDNHREAVSVIRKYHKEISNGCE